MKKLKENQLGPWCGFCAPKTTRATHRENGARGMFCCQNHRQELKDHEREIGQREERYTEADHQTWGSL
jgi:hypothetical protein